MQLSRSKDQRFEAGHNFFLIVLSNFKVLRIKLIQIEKLIIDKLIN